MVTHAPAVDLPLCFQTVCDQRSIFASLLCCQIGRQAGVRQSSWLISKCQGLPLTVFLTPVLERQAAYLWRQCLGQEDCYCSWDAGCRCCTPLLKSRHTVIPEERVFIHFFGDCFFSACVILCQKLPQSPAQRPLVLSLSMESWACVTDAGFVPACTCLFLLQTGLVHCVQGSPGSTYIV